jgi:UDP-2,3-diacylglucosamine pyrophosphatase LpxH
MTRKLPGFLSKNLNNMFPMINLVRIITSRLVRAVGASSSFGFLLVVTQPWLIAQESALAEASRRQVVVIADLHMGEGRDEAGFWYPQEDFRWAEEFRLFLRALDIEGNGSTDLILNGDTFELWQSTASDCVYEERVFGCTETEALARIERVLAAHSAEVNALANFARTGSNRVVLVPGDHDAALLFPAVQTRVEQALGSPASRVSVATAGHWVSSDGQVFVEHGHQIRWRANRFADWPTPFIEQDGRRHLEHPWGAQTVEVFLSDYEARYPVVDNFADEGAGVTHGLGAAGLIELGPRAVQFLRYVLFRLPWQQFRVDLDAGDVQPPSWDLISVREEGSSFFLGALPDDDRFKPVARSIVENGLASALMDELTDAELTALCDYRAAVRSARRRFERPLTQIDPQGPPVAECPRAPNSRGGQYDYFWRSRDLMFGGRLRAIEADALLGQRPVAIYVHSHTHLVDWRQRVLELTRLGRPVIVDGFSPVRNALSPVVVNGGAWQRTITPVQFARLQEASSLSDAGLLEELRPEDLPACYSFVHVAPYDEIPSAPTIRYWRQDEATGDWGMASRCGLQPFLPIETSR